MVEGYTPGLTLITEVTIIFSGNMQQALILCPSLRLTLRNIPERAGDAALHA